jgi:hypothetical protein
MHGVFHKLSKEVADHLFIAVRMEFAMEMTVFDGEGRDTTTRGNAGDYLVLEQIGGEYWVPISVMSPGEMAEVFEEIGSSAP